MKQMKKTILRGLAILGLLPFLVASARAAPDYLSLTMSGNEMAPAICNGDTVIVKTCNDGSLIKAGPQTGANLGDIIVFSTIVATSQPRSMWMCGRAISKYFENGHWYFKTKADNSQKPDPWEVPEYFLLGVVVEVTHNSNSSGEQATLETSPLTDIVSFLFNVTVGIVIGLVLGFAARKVFSKTKPSTPFSCSRALGILALNAR
jgi:hypothetical protein